MRVKPKKFLGQPWLLFLLAFAPLTGCYAYVESGTEALSPGVNARIRLDPESFGMLVNQAASDGYDAQRLDHRRRGFVGRVTEVTPDSMGILLRGAGGSVYTARIPTWSISEAAVRQFDLKKSILIAGGSITLFSAAFLGGWVGGTTQVESSPNVPANFMAPTPIITIPFP